MMKKNRIMNKIERFTKEHGIWIAGIVMLIFVAVYFYYDTVQKIASEEGGLYFADEVTWDDPIDITHSQIVQTYTTTRAEISYMGFAFKKEGRFKEDAYVLVQVEKEETQELLQEWRIPVADGVSEDDNYVCVNYPIDKNATFIGDKGIKLNIKISVENPGNEGKIYIAQGKNLDHYDYGVLTVDGRKVNKQLAINIYGKVKYIQTLYIIIVLGFLFILSALVVTMKKKCLKIENAFFILAIFLGGAYLLIFTPGTEPDADAHFATAYYDANVLLGRERENSDGNVIMRLEDTRKDGLKNLAQLRNMNTTKENLLTKSEDNQETGFYRGRLNVPITAHLPQSIGLCVGILSGMGATLTAYCGKVMALLFYIVCCYIGIRLMPFGKEILAFVALLPFSMETATSYSYDCEVLALSLLMFGYIMYLTYQKPKITWKDIAAWCVLTAWIGPCKVVYVLLGEMILLIPKEKYKNRKMYWGTMGIVLITGIASIYITRLSSVSSVVSGEVEGNYYTISMFLKNIPQGLLMIGKSIELYFDEYIKQMFGSMYSWMDINLPFTFAILYVVLMVVVSIRSESEKYEITKIQKGILGGTSLLIAGGIVAGLMFGWTLKDSVAVEGIQGRYFLPVLPAFMLLLRNKWIVSKKSMGNWAIVAIGVLQYITYLKLYVFIISR